MVFFHLLCGVSFSSTLLAALILPVAWMAVFFFGLGDPSSETYRVSNLSLPPSFPLAFTLTPLPPSLPPSLP